MDGAHLSFPFVSMNQWAQTNEVLSELNDACSSRLDFNPSTSHALALTLRSWRGSAWPLRWGWVCVPCGHPDIPALDQRVMGTWWRDTESAGRARHWSVAHWCLVGRGYCTPAAKTQTPPSARVGTHCRNKKRHRGLERVLYLLHQGLH